MRKERNVLQQRTYEHPTEYYIYSLDPEEVGERFFVCPTCGKQVLRLFTYARDPNEARELFDDERSQEKYCGRCLATAISDREWKVLIPPEVKTEAKK